MGNLGEPQRLRGTFMTNLFEKSLGGFVWEPGSKVPHTGSTLKSSDSPRSHIKVQRLKIEVPQGATYRNRFHPRLFKAPDI